MMEKKEYQNRLQELQARLEESEQLIEAIRAGEVDAFAIGHKNEQEIYTLQSGDYAYRVLIEELPEGAVNATAEGMIVYTNPGFCQLAGCTYEEIIGSSIFRFIHPESSSNFNQLFSNAVSGKSKGEVSLLVNGKRIPVYISFTSLMPKLPTIGMIITDLGEKKQFEKTLADKNRRLVNANQELEKMNKELQAFAYVSSHDLQEPLRKIQTFSNRIMESEQDRLTEEGILHFGKIQAAAERMQTLINDLLAYSRMNVSQHRFVKTDLVNIIAEVKEELKEEIEARNAVILTEGLGTADVIPFQIRQLLHNLIANSLKFSKPGEQPRINIRYTIEQEVQLSNNLLPVNTEYCHLSVADNGIGFEQEYSDKIFEVFQQLHSRKAYGGTGIGLSIVKKIVENHQGYIQATGALNKGAVFDIYLPLTTVDDKSDAGD